MGIFEVVDRMTRLFARAPEPVVEPVKMTKVRRIARAYVPGEIELARRLLGVTRHYIRIIREVGLGENHEDEFLIGYLNAIPLSLASQSFTEIYEEMSLDPRLTESEKDL